MKISFAFLFFLIFIESGYSQRVSTPFRIMFYNVENFFDTSDDTLKEDNEFLPEGLMRWNSGRYNKKLKSLYKTIIASGDWDPPDIISFCEIEHKCVLEDLVYRTYLSKFGYSIIHEESPDRRGIDVCLIFRKTAANLISYKYLIPEKARLTEYNSRSVLWAKFQVGEDSIHLFVNHWPSRRGGVLAGEGTRQDIASMIRSKVDSIIDNDQKSKIIIGGDFNCTPGDQIMQDFIKSSDPFKLLINLSDSLSFSGRGTYRYMGTWEIIDQVMVSKNLVTGKEGLFTRGNWLKIFEQDFLMQKDLKYPGLSPYPTYRGYKYLGGFSDHLPVLLDLNVRK